MLALAEEALLKEQVKTERKKQEALSSLVKLMDKLSGFIDKADAVITLAHERSSGLD